MDYAIFAHKPRLLDVAAQQKHSAHAALGLAVKWLHGTTFWALKVTSQVATPGRSLQSMTAYLHESWRTPLGAMRAFSFYSELEFRSVHVLRTSLNNVKLASIPSY